MAVNKLDKTINIKCKACTEADSYEELYRSRGSKYEDVYMIWMVDHQRDYHCTCGD